MRDILKNKSHIELPMIEEEVLAWYAMSPADRFVESLKLWEVFILFGGQCDPEPFPHF